VASVTTTVCGSAKAAASLEERDVVAHELVADHAALALDDLPRAHGEVRDRRSRP
jgi:hypothetical protein